MTVFAVKKNPTPMIVFASLRETRSNWQVMEPNLGNMMKSDI